MAGDKKRKHVLFYRWDSQRIRWQSAVSNGQTSSTNVGRMIASRVMQKTTDKDNNGLWKEKDWSSRREQTSTSTSTNCSTQCSSLSDGFWDAGDFEEEAPVSSASFEIRCEDIQLHKWDVWLNNGRESNKNIKDKLQCLPQWTGVTTTAVQWMVLKSDAGDFNAEAPVGSVTFEIRMKGIQCRYWEAWLMVNKYNPEQEPHGIPQWWKWEKKRTTEIEKKVLNASLSELIGLSPRHLDNCWLMKTIKQSTYFNAKCSGKIVLTHCTSATVVVGWIVQPGDCISVMHLCR